MADFKGNSGGYRGTGGYGGKGAFQGRGGGKRDSVDNSVSLPSGYNADDIRDKNGDFNVDYVTNVATDVAKAISQSNMGTSKIRSYYDMLIKTIDEVRSKSININMATREVAMMLSRVKARYTKETASKAFLDFITLNTNRILEIPDNKRVEAMQDFKYHYEAVIGFMSKK